MNHRVAAAMVLATALASGCSGGNSGCPDEDYDPPLGGLSALGFAISSNGQGYLSGRVGFGECGAYLGTGRVFAIDLTAGTSSTIEVPDLPGPGKVLVDEGGKKAIAMAFRDANGLVGSAPPGIEFIDGTDARLIPLGDRVWDIHAAPGLWVVSAGAGGSWFVNSEDGTTQGPVRPNSFCGAWATGRFLICEGSSVAVLDSAGALVSQIALPEPPRFVGGTADVAVVLFGTAIGIIRGDALVQTVDLVGDVPDYAWVSADSMYAIARSSERGHLLELADGSWNSFETVFPLRDVAFSGSRAFVASGVEDWMGEFDFSTGSWSTVFAPSFGLISQVEATEPGKIAVAFSSPFYLTFMPGDVANGVIAVYDTAAGWGQPMDIVVE